MKHRSPLAVFFLPFITFGIYSIVWYVKTKNEMNRVGAKIPTAWLLIIPLVNIYWLWKYCVGVDTVTSKKMSAGLSFVILWLLGIIGMAIIQDSFNNATSAAVSAAGIDSPAPPVAQPAMQMPATPQSPSNPQAPRPPKPPTLVQ